MVKLRPLRDRIIVERSSAEEKTTGGIVLPDTAKDKPKQGTIISVGPGKVLENGKVLEPQVKKGDKILFGSFAGTEVKIEGKEYLILSEGDILAILE
jgi:chaperonin GroES